MGKPVRLRSDRGPQFRSEFEDWAKKEKLTYELSSPYDHQSNGHAEVAVREMKHLLTQTERNWQKFRLVLREYRNTPQFDGLSPSQWLTGYRQRTDVPAAPSAYERITDEQLKSHLNRSRQESRTEVGPNVKKRQKLTHQAPYAGYKIPKQRGGWSRSELSRQGIKDHSSSMMATVSSYGTGVSWGQDQIQKQNLRHFHFLECGAYNWEEM